VHGHPTTHNMGYRDFVSIVARFIGWLNSFGAAFFVRIFVVIYNRSQVQSSPR
jgi:hypothetical protein